MIGRNDVLSREECEALGRRVLELVSAPQAQVLITSSVGTAMEFARGDTHMAGETHSLALALTVEFDGRRATARTNRVTEEGLRALVAEAEAMARAHRSPEPWGVLPPQTYLEGPPIYYQSVANVIGADAQVRAFHQAADAADAAGLIAAGTIRAGTSARAAFTTQNLAGYERGTYGEFSLTARTRDGSGSGWAWSGHEDWDRVEVRPAIARAVGLARRSASPVAVEPGRYTVILEPAAVAALIEPIMAEWSARWADLGMTVFSGEERGTNKIGLQMLDQRLGLVSSPWDPERPASTIAPNWSPITRPAHWFENGILKNLAYDTLYARQQGREPVLDPGGVRLTVEGATQSLEEMIASTSRGIWVNRFSHLAAMNRKALLLTGTTRDGTFLIENGKITRPIKNFRFTESPFFVLNQLEAWGDPVRASRLVVAPRLMLRDFNFTSLTDAV